MLISTSFFCGVLTVLVGCNGSERAAVAESDRTNSSPAAERGDSASGSKSIRDQSSNSSNAAAKLREAIDQRDWNLAKSYCQSALISSGDDPDVVTNVAIVNAQSGDRRTGARLLADAAQLASYSPSSRVNLAAQALVGVGEIHSAIELLENSLRENPGEDALRRMLVGFLAEAQLSSRYRPHMKELIRRRAFDLPLLVSTTDTSARYLSESTAAKLLKLNPQDLRIRLVDAFLYLYRHDFENAVVVLNQILEKHPDFVPAQAMLGRALAGFEQWEAFPQWFHSTLPSVTEYADFWLAIGDAAAQNDSTAAAAWAYHRAGRVDPNLAIAWNRLRLTLLKLNADSDGSVPIPNETILRIAEHERNLMKLGERFSAFNGEDDQSQEKATEVALRLFHLGRIWEAEAWTAIATTLPNEKTEKLASVREKVIQKLRTSDEWIHPDTPVLNLDLDHLPKAEPEKIAGVEIGHANLLNKLAPAVLTPDHLRLVDSSQPWGLRGIGAGNNPDDARLAPLIRSTGSGGGAIDFDLDGLPDLFVVNAGGKMLREDSMPNNLMRNIGTTFITIGANAMLQDRGFGQGAAIGDFNEDGFPDLYVGNLGKKKLYRNNGDGTFSDVSDLLGDQSDGWYTSGCFADINGDTLADLAVIRYCQTVDHLDQACHFGDGSLGPCHPLKFPGDTDQFFRMSENGTLMDVTRQWVSDISAGRGLAMVAGALTGKNVEVFVANDMSRNFFYSARDSATGSGNTGSGNFELSESGAIRGVAVDGLTRAQASMGIASSDFDLDGDLDFYVTGFAREYNTYHEQVSPGIWKDTTTNLGLDQPTLGLVGFGTEAVDLDNDGMDELIVTNGHIGDFDSPDIPPYEMPMQVFRRNEQGKFSLVDDDHWSEYFRTSHVGRALWTTDVNRDGRVDVFVTDLHESVKLLVNETSTDNDRIGFKLVATKSSRDGVGAVIRFRCGNQSRVLWMLSGDGYLCSNEKTLIAGLGDCEAVSDVAVTWQDGSITEISQLKTNRQYLIVQGQDEPFVMHSYE